MPGVSYEIWRGRRLVGITNSRLSAKRTLTEYLRSKDCGDTEIVWAGSTCAAWQGTIYRVTVVGSDLSSPERVATWEQELQAAVA